MRFTILKCGCAVIAGSIFVQTLAPACPHGNDLCEMQTEPPHVPHEIPGRDTFTVRSPAAASGSNVNVKVEFVKMAADIRNPAT